MQVDIIKKLHELIDQNKEVALVTLTKVEGSVPQEAGAMMIVDKAGMLIAGTIGGGSIERRALKDAKECIRKNKSQSFSYTLDMRKSEQSLGMACGGAAEIMIQVFSQEDVILLVGGGHVAHALYQLAKDLPYTFVIVDDREMFASSERFPEAKTHCGNVVEILQNLELPASTSAVIVSHNHEHDIDALREIVKKDYRYIGMIGSKKKVKFCFDTLKEEGIDPKVLQQVYAPIGLPIGGDHPSEIALSILSQIQAKKYGRRIVDYYEK